MKNGFNWLIALMLAGIGKHNPQSFFDRTPLRKLLDSHLNLKSIQTSIDSGILHAVSITASSYTSAQSVNFYQGEENIKPWVRARRIGRKAELNIDHLMASSAIPFIFKPVRINREYYGDGSMRQVAPISSALHLGADQILVIGNRYENDEDDIPTREITEEGPPSIAQIAGHVLSSIFLDALETDLERLQRINKTVNLIPSHILEEGGVKLKQINTLCISPSEDIDLIARNHVHHLPWTIRALLRGIGAYRKEGSSLISYLLFEKPYCCELIELGYKDAMNQKTELQQFLGLEVTP
jgi:NTE family protein